MDALLAIVKLSLLGQGRKITLRTVITEKVGKAIPLCLENASGYPPVLAKGQHVTMNIKENITTKTARSLLEDGLSTPPPPQP